MSKLVDQLIDQGILKTPEIIAAFRKINRRDFMVEAAKDKAEVNEPFPIGFNQTISQPSTVAFMLELLQPKKGQIILDIGSGSGWTTALLSEIVGETGKVYAVEIIEELKEFGEKNAEKYGFVSRGIAKFICADGSKGLEEYAPFDRIHVAAAASEIPRPLLEQLRIGGRLVIPVGVYTQDMVLVRKIDEDQYEREKHPGFVFVPLISKDKS